MFKYFFSLIIGLLGIISHVRAGDTLNRYQLLYIDSTSMSEYYLLGFEVPDSIVHDTMKIISPRYFHGDEGCWHYLKIGCTYKLNLYEVRTLIFHCNGLNYHIPDGGFSDGTRIILKPGEYFYSTKQISGRLIKDEAR